MGQGSGRGPGFRFEVLSSTLNALSRGRVVLWGGNLEPKTYNLEPGTVSGGVPRTFHACNVRARVMKTAVGHSGGADLNHERETENFSVGSGNGGSGSRSQRYRGI